MLPTTDKIIALDNKVGNIINIISTNKPFINHNEKPLAYAVVCVLHKQCSRCACG